LATLYRQPGRLNIVDHLRKAIRDSGETEYGIAKAAGVAQSVVNRFAPGRRDTSLETPARICLLRNLSFAPCASGRVVGTVRLKVGNRGGRKG